MELPVEIRLKIYHELLVRDKLVSLDADEVLSYDSNGHIPRYPAILRASKQVCQEALPVLYQQNRVGMCIDSSSLNTIGGNCCVQLKYVRLYFPPRVSSDQKDPLLAPTWRTLCEACVNLKRISVVVNETELQYFYPLLAIAISTTATRNSLVSPCSLRVVARSVVDSARNSVPDLEFGLARVTNTNEYQGRFWMRRPSPCALESIHVRVYLNVTRLKQLRSDIRQLDRSGFGFVSLGPDDAWNDITEGKEFYFEWRGV